jgi:hypothetical protein
MSVSLFPFLLPLLLLVLFLGVTLSLFPFSLA